MYLFGGVDTSMYRLENDRPRQFGRQSARSWEREVTGSIPGGD